MGNVQIWNHFSFLEKYFNLIAKVSTKKKKKKKKSNDTCANLTECFLIYKVLRYLNDLKFIS